MSNNQYTVRQVAKMIKIIKKYKTCFYLDCILLLIRDFILNLFDNFDN